jgi:hypothetical protein
VGGDGALGFMPPWEWCVLQVTLMFPPGHAYVGNAPSVGCGVSSWNPVCMHNHTCCDLWPDTVPYCCCIQTISCACELVLHVVLVIKAGCPIAYACMICICQCASPRLDQSMQVVFHHTGQAIQLRCDVCICPARGMHHQCRE